MIPHGIRGPATGTPGTVHRATGTPAPLAPPLAGAVGAA